MGMRDATPPQTMLQALCAFPLVQTDPSGYLQCMLWGFVAGFGGLGAAPWRTGAHSSGGIPSDSLPWKSTVDFCYDAPWLDFDTSRVNTDTSVYWYYSMEQGHVPKTKGLCGITAKVTLPWWERKRDRAFAGLVTVGGKGKMG